MSCKTIGVRVYHKGIAELLSLATCGRSWGVRITDNFDTKGYIVFDLTYNTNDEDDSFLSEFIETFKDSVADLNVKVERTN